MIGGFKGSLRVALSQNSRIIEVHYRSADPQMAANIVNTLMQTYVENNFKAASNPRCKLQTGCKSNLWICK